MCIYPKGQEGYQIIPADALTSLESLATTVSERLDPFRSASSPARARFSKCYISNGRLPPFPAPIGEDTVKNSVIAGAAA